ncbi:hypothetical protein [Thaumasiovibrio subtropicus]|uniref:hypothetical protein n=1 Tax=Thaumasiovibrio subtropicus TaxID=1891207 RepID=UPI000B36348C|nr:hypothetical protein [Thaumasiovibrio subtropicus]
MKYLYLVMALAITGCASTDDESSAKEAAISHPEPAEQVLNVDTLVVDIMTEKLEKNGRSIFCDQPSYIGCYNISRTQCLAELALPHERCLARTNDKTGGLTADNLESHSQYYGACLALEHIMSRIDNLDQVEQISECIGSAEIDPNTAAQSLLQ